jgi:hypothetical protein
MTHGEPVRHADDSLLGRRLHLEGGGWSLNVDELPRVRDRANVAQATRGYALTQAADAWRSDASTFSSEDLLGLEEALSHFGSFARGSPCGAVLPVGFDALDAAVWSRWTCGWVDGDLDPWSWCDDIEPAQLMELFPGFMARWDDPYWRGILRLAIQCYIEVNVPTMVDLAVALAYVVLEMLAYAWLTVERRRTSDRRFKDATAVRTLLTCLQTWAYS